MKNLFFLFLIVLCSCSNKDHYGLGEFDNINTSDAIKGMFNSCAAQQKKEGLSAKLKYLSHALESFYIPPNHKTEIGSDSLKSLYVSWDKQNKIVDYTINDVQVFPINKICAIYHYRVEITYLDSSQTKKELRQLESGAVLKVEEKWLYLNSQSQSIE